MDRVTHKMYIADGGTDLVSPVSGSMRPMIREHRDYGVFQAPKQELRRYDVVLYRRGGATLMHRVLRVGADSCEVRGDNAPDSEIVPRQDIFAVMTGFYHGDRLISCQNPVYRLYARSIVAFHPYIEQYRFSNSALWRCMRGIVNAARRTLCEEESK